MSSSPRPRVHVIACGVLSIDISAAADRLGIEITTDYLPGGLHDRPSELRQRLQETIDAASSAGETPGLIAVGYGVCGRGTVGIHARTVPLVIPRVHDCIALFLGSDAAYRREFHACPGTYYISAGWYNEKVQPRSQKQVRRASACKADDPAFAELVGKYGPENAEAITEFLSSWTRNYSRAAFIDTGAGGRERYASYARAMAKEFGWVYKELPGSLDLLEKTLDAEASTPEVLVVPPGYVTTYDPLARGLEAVPPWKGDSEVRETASGPAGHFDLPKQGNARKTASGSAKESDVKDRNGSPENAFSFATSAQSTTESVAHEPASSGSPIRYGLGIDAGGTYTDVVIYDFSADAVLAKNKAPTTKWDFPRGIGEALAGIERDLLSRVEMTAVSTTLATNAIVEGHGQKVGLLIMPPNARMAGIDIRHEPRAVIAGQMDIAGREITGIDEEQIRRIARDMVRAGVRAFAVSGYASTINPAHEMTVKAILREETGLAVTCGHELSDLLNFQTRATTAVLNARIIPRLDRFLRAAESVLAECGVHAPMMVVKGDGSLMATAVALEKPVETIMSGPAASVAGATFLTGRRDAVVVDIGGTTTDTAALADGLVRVSEGGTTVGGFRTHVKALHMRTVGLGGDSLIRLDKGRLMIGPGRVAPLAWLAETCPGVEEALAFLHRKLDDYRIDSAGMVLAARADAEPPGDLAHDERAVLDALGDRPCSLTELAGRLGRGHHSLLRLEGLLERHLLHMSALTPTDVLHVMGRFGRWNADIAGLGCRQFAELLVPAGAIPDVTGFCRQVVERFVHRLAEELIRKQMDDRVDPDVMDDCPACRVLMDNVLGIGRQSLRLEAVCEHPVIGIGAPVEHFLPEAGRLINAEVIIPHDADVANAIGAITSQVRVSRSVRIHPHDTGGFAIEGLAGAPVFETLDEAHRHAEDVLAEAVRAEARAAGTCETSVQTQTRDRIAETADGSEVFLERVVIARIAGRPDAVVR